MESPWGKFEATEGESTDSEEETNFHLLHPETLPGPSTHSCPAVCIAPGARSSFQTLFPVPVSSAPWLEDPAPFVEPSSRHPWAINLKTPTTSSKLASAWGKRGRR